tara:strand:+ start:24904 stop:25143 length:240 start_codon:yes stop_codon:yes gene_type:complete
MTGCETTDDRLLLVSSRINIDWAVDTSGTKRSSGNTLSSFASPWARDLAAAKGLNCAGDFGCLFPFIGLRGFSAATARP